jgi:putative intracellular protease/amidase
MVNILVVLSSCGRVPGTDRRTGTWLEELASPYYVFREAGARVRLVSVAGGAAPLDPTSLEGAHQTDATRRFLADPEATHALSTTSKLCSISPESQDAVFYSGGLGPIFDLSEDRSSIALIEAMMLAGKPVAAVCHAPAVLLHARDARGAALVAGRAVTAFSKSEEIAVNGAGEVPYFIEDELRRLGGEYGCAPDGQPHVVRDGTLITGQNPASSEGAARALLAMMGRPAPRK